MLLAAACVVVTPRAHQMSLSTSSFLYSSTLASILRRSRSERSSFSRNSITFAYRSSSIDVRPHVAGAIWKMGKERRGDARSDSTVSVLSVRLRNAPLPLKTARDYGISMALPRLSPTS